MAAVFGPDRIRQPYSVRGDRIWQNMAAVFGPLCHILSGQNIAATSRPDQIRLPYSVRGTKIWQPYLGIRDNTVAIIYIAAAV